MGTAEYMAPEQACDASQVDIRADLYSLGCTLYYLLAGHPPFGPPEYVSEIAKLMAHVQAPFPDVIAQRGDVPVELASILARLVAKNPADRFSQPAEVVAALEPWCDGANLPGLLSPGDGPAGPLPVPVCSATPPVAQAADRRVATSAIPGRYLRISGCLGSRRDVVGLRSTPLPRISAGAGSPCRTGSR